MRERKAYGIEKKVFSLILTLALLLSVVPVPALAAGTPAEANGIYQIGTAEELLWFAQEVNGGNTGISGVLTADIDMSAVANWPGIGTNHKPFSGSFDGKGHTVTFRNAMWGMFGFVAGKSGAIVTIQNVKTAGSVQRSPIAHDVTFTHIIGCINGATVTKANENYVGGIVGSVRYTQVGTTFTNDVLIQNCGNAASITANDYVGGIMGSACYVNTRIENCYNTGNIHGNTYVGGIVGWHQSHEGSNHVKNSYNTGRVTGSGAVAGIAGYLSNGVTVQNCYNAGASTYAVIGQQYNTTNVISNTYFLGTASAKSVPDYTTYESQEPVYRGTAKTAADMASADFAALLGDAYKASCPYPVLAWQTAAAHTGSVCNNCQLGSTEKEYYDVSFQQHAGYTLNGESKATQGQAYSFTITISEGYEKIAGFAVKVNGKEVTPASDGKYTVMNVQEPLSITVRNVQVIPGNHVISLPGAGYGYTITGEKSAKRDEDYTFNLAFVDGFKAGTDFKVMAQEIVPQSELNNGYVAEEKTLTGKNGTYTIPNVQKDYRILVSGVVAVPTVAPVTVNFTVTEGWYEFHEPNDSGEVIIDKTLTVPYFDLSLYGLEKYYYNPYCYLDENGNIRNIQQKGTPETAYNNITVMHAFIVATERFYLGYGQDEVGTGASYKKNPAAFREAISWSQDAGSSFMDFWDHGTNLNYYLNYAYPLAYAGWGSTSDQEVIKNGDIISIHLITGQGSGSNFGFFVANDDNNKFAIADDLHRTNEITVDQGEKVKLTYYWTATSGNYKTSYKVQKNKQLYWINAEEDGIPGYMEPDEILDYDENGKPIYGWDDNDNPIYVSSRGWRNEPLGKNTVLKTDNNGQITINTAGLEPGTYYIGGIGGFEAGGQADNAGFVSTGYEAGAAFFKIVVQEYNGKLGDVDNDTEITAKDATIILRYVINEVSEINDAIADVDADGSVTAKDATMILRYVINEITAFPADSK